MSPFIRRRSVRHTDRILARSVFFIVLWSAFLLLYWGMGIPLGLQAPYTYP